jgi:type IV pilus assembly protein PilC
MPKKTADFAFSGQETFKIDNQEQKKEAPVFFDIGKSSENLQYLGVKKVYTKLTGNPLIDFYHKINDYLIAHSKVKAADLANFFRLLAIMINAGVPLIQSLETLGSQTGKSPKLSMAILDMAAMVEQGKSLSEAMFVYPDIFSEAQIGMVHSGEVTGQLNIILNELAHESEKTAQLISKLRSAMIYPVVILVIMGIVLTVMMVMVLPQMAQLFTQTNQQLPWITTSLITLSDLMVDYGIFVLAAFGGLIIIFSMLIRTRKGRYFWDTVKLNMPIFGDLQRKTAIARFAGSFGNLLGSGVSIIDSLQIVAKAMGNEVYRKLLNFAAEDLKKGIALAENLSESKYFSKMLVDMIEVGEKTAQLENVTRKVSDFYSDEVDTAVSALTKTMEPLMITVIGVMVGGLVAAIMLPIIQLTESAGV